MDAAGSQASHWAAPLYDGCAAELVLYGRALGLRHVEAEDVLHDTFRVLLALPESPREPRFYLLRAFRNRALNHRRGLWRRLAREWRSTAWFEPSSGESPFERRATEALRGLPPEQREVIVLKIWHELTFDAIAELLGLSPNTVAGRYRYGIRKLRETLETTSHETAEEPLPGDDPTWLAAPRALPER